MTNSKQKISMLRARIKNIDEKMKNLVVQKKECERQIREIEENDILSIIRENNVDIDTLGDDLAFIKVLKEANITKNDILELVTEQEQPEPLSPPENGISVEKINNEGVINNENK